MPKISVLLQTLITRLRKSFGLEGHPVIMAYRGYGNPRKVFLKGHVLDDRLLYESEKGDRKRRNFLAMLSRYMSRAMPHKTVKATFAGREFTFQSDEEGYFEAELQFDIPLEAEGWLPAKYELPDGDVVPVSESSVYIQEKDSEFGIISDVDDTILISHASKALRKLRLILTKNAKTRLPFSGVASFYRALQTGLDKDCCNPIFYVSSSEWNLYDFLVDFCEVRGIPKGPFLLQKYKANLWEVLRSGGGSHMHKVDKIRHLLEAYPELNFILIGDSGQKDAQLYAEVAREFPGRILAVYIRDVTGPGKKEARLRELSAEMKENGVDMLLAKDTAEAALHAYENGFVTEEEYEKVCREVKGKEWGAI